MVSWNTRELLGRCLRSLHPEVEAGRAAVWVADNASSDGSPDLVREQAPWATLLETGANLGFGAAVDLVAARTESPWLAAANADIEVTPGALEAMLAAGEGADVGVVAPRLVHPDGATQHSVHPFPTVAFALAFNLGLPRVAPSLARRWCLEDGFDPEQPQRVPWAVGAFLLVRRQGFDRVGGFDARQWMYAEDLDLCWRMSEAGYATAYEPRAVVRHAESAATTAAFGQDKAPRFMAATYEVIARRRGYARALATAGVNVAGAGVRARHPEPRRWLRAHVSGARAALLGAAGRLSRDAAPSRRGCRSRTGPGARSRRGRARSWRSWPPGRPRCPRP